MNYQFKKLVMNLFSDVLTLIDLHSQIEETDKRLSVKRDERDYWLEYKNVGSKAQADKIMNLEKNIKEVKDDFHRATGQLTASVMQVLQAHSVLLLGTNEIINFVWYQVTYINFSKMVHLN